MTSQMRSKTMSPWLLIVSLLAIAAVLAVAVVARKRVGSTEVDR
jgi:hypothetical protein